MSDLISRKALVDEAIRIGNDYFHQFGDWNTEEVISLINRQPTIDAVPVVLCKDCKYWGHGDCYRHFV